MTARDLVHVAGMAIHPAHVRRAAEEVLAASQEDLGRLFVLVNAHSAALRRRSSEYAAVLAGDPRCVTCLPDGSSVTIAARLLGWGPIGRCPGPDLLEAVCSAAAKSGVRVFLLGGEPGVADQLSEALKRRHPGLTIAGAVSPPFGDWPEESSRQLVETVRSSGARILFMGVSAPKQEIWAYEHLEELGMPVVCVGAAFDFNSGRKPRAPKWVRRIGMEWLFRLLTEPRRLWRRYLVGNALFMWDVVRYGRRPAPAPK